MSESLRERFQGLQAQLAVLAEKTLSNPHLELTYNRWLQIPKDQRRRALLITKAVFLLSLFSFFIVGTVHLLRHQRSLWRANALVEKIAAYQVEAGHLKSVVQRFSELGGVFQGSIEERLAPVYSKLMIQPSTIKLVPLPENKDGVLRRLSYQLELSKVTLKQLVELLFEVENAGANVRTSQLSMKALDENRGWFQASVQIALLLPLENSPPAETLENTEEAP